MMYGVGRTGGESHMNERCFRIIQQLIRAKASGDVFTLRDLAAEYDVSERTIRNDITKINALLKSHDLGEIEFGPRGLTALPEDFVRIERFLPRNDFYVYKLSADERRVIIVSDLLVANSYVTLSELAERLFVSRTTVINDLPAAKSFIEDYGLRVVSKPKFGLIVEGLESKRRRAFGTNVNNAGRTMRALLSDSHGISSDDVEVIKKLLAEQNHAYQVHMTDRTFNKVLYSLVICVKRNRMGCRLEPQEPIQSHLDEYTRTLMALVSQYCLVDIEENDVCFILGVLERCQSYVNGSFKIEDVRAQMVTRDFIMLVSQDLQVNLNDDYVLFAFLSNHLESMLATEPSSFIEDPSLAEAVNDQPEVLQTVRAHLEVIEDYYERPLTEVETVFVALHICAALERRKNKEGRVRVAIVCDEGAGPSSLLAEALKGRFGFRVVRTIPSYEIPFLDPKSVDFVVSTVPLGEDCQVDAVYTSVMPTEQECQQVRDKIDEVRATGRLDLPTTDHSAHELLEAIDRQVKKIAPEKQDELMRAIRIEVRRSFSETQHLEEEILTPYLHQLLTEGHIQLDVACTDWRDAVRKSAEPLMRMGYIEESYIDAMIAGVEQQGPYIVLTKGLAIPHENPKEGAVRMGMNLIRLKTPVRFGAGKNDPVRFVCTLSATDHKSHLRAFFNLVNMFAKPEVLRDMGAVQTPREASEYITLYERRIMV